MDNNIAEQILTEMRAGFDRLDNRIDRLENRLDNRIDSLFDLHKSEMSGVRRRFATVNAQFEAVNAQFEAVNTRFDSLENEMRAGFARQEKFSKDIVQETISYVHALASSHDKAFAHIEGFLSQEFPDKYTPHKW